MPSNKETLNALEEAKLAMDQWDTQKELDKTKGLLVCALKTIERRAVNQKLHLLIQEDSTGDFMYWGAFGDDEGGRKAIRHIVCTGVTYFIVKGRECQI